MWQSVYESSLFHPVLFWIAGAFFVVAIASRMKFLQGFLVLGAFEILADATLTGPWSPVPQVRDSPSRGRARGGADASPHPVGRRPCARGGTSVGFSPRGCHANLD